MHATRAAVEEGIVPGGGVALVRASRVLEKFDVHQNGGGDADEQIGVNIVRRALEEPLRQIVQNAPDHLADSGWFLLEHGHDQAAAVRQLLETRGFAEVQSRDDLAGIQRCSGGIWRTVK